MDLERTTEFGSVVELVRYIKPSLADSPISSRDLLIESLGFDSLDVTQLARSVRRKIRRDFDQDAWLEGARDHKLSIASLVAAILAVAATS